MRELNVQEVDQVSGGFLDTIADWYNDLTTFDVGGTEVQVEPQVDPFAPSVGIKVSTEF